MLTSKLPQNLSTFKPYMVTYASGFTDTDRMAQKPKTLNAKNF